MHPVECVTWYDCDKATRRLGLILPTEAQWEYAARAGTSSIWWTGNEISTLQGAANLSDAHAKSKSTKLWLYEDSLDDGYRDHAPVGTYRANPFGLHDVIGNVWEWCRDPAMSYATKPNPGDGLREGILTRKNVARGGSYYNLPHESSSAHRSKADRTDTASDRGLRPARSLDR